MRLSQTRSILFGIALALAGFLGSCKKNSDNPPPVTPPNPPVTPPTTPAYSDTVGPLKTFAAANGGMLFGIESDYPTVTTTPVNLGIIAREAAITTFGYGMKHGAVVQNDGSFNYANTDAQFNAVVNAGLLVHGHTLLWYSNQNATYLNSVVAGTSLSSVPNLLGNGSFETWSGGIPAGWSIYNQTNGSFAQGTGTGNVASGSSSLMVTVTAAGQAYNTQLVSNAFTTVSGHSYTVTFYIMATATGGLWQLEAPYGVNYTGTKTAPTAWTPEVYSFTANSASAMIAFDMGTNPGIYYIDSVKVVDATASGSPGVTPAAVAAVDSVLKRWISGPDGIVTRYAGKVKAWDVVNEPMSDGNGGLRTSGNTSIPSPRPGDWFFWGDYLGRTAALHAFQYARTADPNALLFINDYNLETNTAKLDSLINYVKELQGEGAHIDGIGTEMHIAYNTSRTGIDAAFVALAATGLKVRISELDVAINPGKATGFTSPPDPTLLASQADTYHYVVSSYIKNVPAAQRFGITIWGVDDAQTWLTTSASTDFPLLFDANYKKKIAYSGVLQALKGN
jgi:endo-1,4-beta-xylanase